MKKNLKEQSKMDLVSNHQGNFLNSVFFSPLNDSVPAVLYGFEWLSTP